MPGATPLYLGDDIAAAAWRLAGLRTVVAEPGREADALEQARVEAPWVLVSAACAANIAPGLLQRVIAAASPLVVVVPDLQGVAPLPDLPARLRAQLGLAP
jgi:vacuolar-type H+-ATPase subunit F/Vma7